MITARLRLETMFVLTSDRRIASTREPNASAGPLFMLIRSSSDCAWATRADVAPDLAAELARLAAEEPFSTDLRQPPLHAGLYASLLGGTVESGPGFSFPQQIEPSANAVQVHDERLLREHFSGWEAGEIDAGAGPVLAIVEDGVPVSVCFCARRAESTAEAGVQTAPAFRGRGYASTVTAAWALAVRATGRTPLYSTNWENEAPSGLPANSGYNKLPPTGASMSETHFRAGSRPSRALDNSRLHPTEPVAIDVTDSTRSSSCEAGRDACGRRWARG